MPEHEYEVLKEQLQKTINNIKGVIAGCILLDSEGDIEEIHVLASKIRNPKQIVRDIESAFMVLHDLKLDHKKISVAQFENDKIRNVSITTNTTKRPKIEKVKMEKTASDIEVAVTLRLGEKVCFASKSGPPSESNRMRLSAEAVLQAIDKLLDGNYGFVLEELTIYDIGNKQAVLCFISMIENSSEGTLIGCVMKRGSREEAAAQAVLDALNRKLFI